VVVVVVVVVMEIIGLMKMMILKQVFAEQCAIHVQYIILIILTLTLTLF